jgi:prephenate dehydrogenase
VSRPLPPRVGVIGLGVIGGSIARALGELADTPHRIGVSADPGEGERALETGALDHLADHPEEVAENSDLLIYATPLDVTVDLLGRQAPLLGPDTVITDVASLKKPVMEAATRAGLSGRFVGSHPMAGSHRSGFGASAGDLFRDSVAWICASGAGSASRDAVHSLWQAVGAVPTPIQAEAHDALMSRVSHLPQVVANALAGLLAEEGIQRTQLGGGGRDMTRLATSPPSMWLPLFRESGPELSMLLRRLAEDLDSLADSLGRGDEVALRTLMERTRHWVGED